MYGRLSPSAASNSTRTHATAGKRAGAQPPPPVMARGEAVVVSGIFESRWWRQASGKEDPHTGPLWLRNLSLASNPERSGMARSGGDATALSTQAWFIPPCAYPSPVCPVRTFAPVVPPFPPVHSQCSLRHYGGWRLLRAGRAQRRTSTTMGGSSPFAWCNAVAA